MPTTIRTIVTTAARCSVIVFFCSCSESAEEPDFSTGTNSNSATAADGSDTGVSGDSGSGGDSGDQGSAGDADGSGSSASAGSTSADSGDTCGNGTVDPGEQCDGANLDGASCESLGEGSGTLGCDPIMCTYDTSMCSGMGSGTSG